jgi:hypothetical protein
MPDTATARHALPNLFLGQAQKEVTHNEALARIDALLHPVVEAELATAPPGLTLADDGHCWLIAAAATGPWAGKDKQIARWTGGSWRYLMPVEGMIIWDVAERKRRFYIDGSWVAPGAVDSPAGGAVIDVEARAALAALLQHLRDICVIDS